MSLGSRTVLVWCLLLALLLPWSATAVAQTGSCDDPVATKNYQAGYAAQKAQKSVEATVHYHACL